MNRCSSRFIYFLVAGCLACSTAFSYAGESRSGETLVSASEVPQSKTLTGKIINEGGAPVAGVSVTEKGTSRATITNADGTFSMTVSGDAIIQVALLGLKSQEVSVAGVSTITITMLEDEQVLDDVVVVGYGVQRKLTATAAVSKVEGDALAKMTTVNSSKALQGITSGITVIDRGGAPGADDPSIFIRGVGTTGVSSPLVLVDGIEMSLSQVPSQEIESISILKDAASASIYGSRAAHGVILVTTKRGSSGRAKITYNGYVGIQDLAIVPKAVSARQYVDMVNEASANRGNSPIYTDEMIQKIVSGSHPHEYTYKNYPREVYKPAYLTQHTVGVSGGNEAVKYSAMFDFLDQPGIVENTNFKRYTYTSNVDVNISKYVRFSSDLSYRHSDRVLPTGLSTAQATAWSFVPTRPVYFEDGRYTLDDQGNNPLASLDPNVSGNETYQRDNATGRAKIEFEPVADLVFTGEVSLSAMWDRNKRHSKNFKFYDASGDNFIRQWNSPNGVSDGRNNRYQLTMRFLADYTKTFADVHNFHVLLGAEQESFRNYYVIAERRNLISDALPDVSLGSASNQYATGYPDARGINSFFGRVNYGYKGRYLFEANLRADGSSRFGKGKKWGVFPSFSGAWRISEESFMKEVSFISNLKLRASWGQTGNERIRDNVGRFLYMPQYVTQDVVMDGNLSTGVYQSRMANPDLTWETVESTDIGLDFAFFNNRLFGEVDYYIKDTKDILLDLAIPKFIGLGAPYRNVGVVRNSGVELMLGYRKATGAFKYSATGNFSYNKNRWMDRQGDDDNIGDWGQIQRTGEELNSFYIYKADGLIANQAELDAYKKQHKADPRGMEQLKPGDVKLVDANNDGTIDPKDRQIFPSNVPNFSYGITINAEFKGFDLSLMFQGTAGAHKFIYGEFMEGPSYEAFTGLHYLDRWTESNQNPDASVPRIEAANNRNNSTHNSFYLKDVSYLRLKNAQLGYTIPSRLTTRVGIQNLRVYLSGSNLLTFSSLFQGMDPELSSGRLYEFPPTKIVTLGVNLTF